MRRSGQRGIDVQCEGIDVPAERADDEGNPLAHKASDESDVAGKPVQLGDSDFTAGFLRGFQRSLEFWAAIQRVRALSGLHLGEFGDDLEALGRSERLYSSALRFQPEAGTALLLR